jgi:hypothetical protein
MIPRRKAGRAQSSYQASNASRATCPQVLRVLRRLHPMLSANSSRSSIDFHQGHNPDLSAVSFVSIRGSNHCTLQTSGGIIVSAVRDLEHNIQQWQEVSPWMYLPLRGFRNFEPCEDAMDWVLGTHGLRISFVHRGRRYGATYLPDVAVEQCWTKEETVESLMRKAGWSGGGSGGGVARRLLRGSTNTGLSGSGKPWDDVYDFRAIRYQGLKASASYAEWQEWRKWAKGQDDGRAQLLDPAS